MDTPLCLAVKGSHIRAVRLLLEAGANADVKVKIEHCRLSLLRVAAMDGQLTIVKLLIAAGANVNETCCWKSPICCAARKGYIRIVEELISAGANVNIMGGKFNEVVESAYLYPEIVELLRQHGATGETRVNHKNE